MIPMIALVATLTAVSQDSACLTRDGNLPRKTTPLSLRVGRSVAVLKVSWAMSDGSFEAGTVRYLTGVPLADTIAERAEAREVLLAAVARSRLAPPGPTLYMAEVFPCRAPRRGTLPRAARAWHFVRDSSGEWQPTP